MSNKILKFFFVFLLVVMFVGCENSTDLDGEFSLILRNADSSIYLESNEEALSEFLLPELEAEGQVFIGWTDGEELYYDETITMIVDYDLTAVFEIASDVFTYSQDGEDKILIEDYTGTAEVLRIPEVIDGYIVSKIGSQAFRDSSIKGVYIPNTVQTIASYAFYNAEDLEFVSYYGEYYGEEDRIISSEEFDDIMEEYADVCTITSGSIDSGVFTMSDGCPVKESFGITGVLNVGDITYFSYDAVLDIENNLDSLHQYILGNAFEGASSLKRIELPARMFKILTSAFNKAYNIEEVTTPEDSLFLEAVDNILYTKDFEVLYYYPSGLPATSFTIPDGVTMVALKAFICNQYLEEILVPDSLEYFLQIDNLPALTNIEVDEDNEFLYSDNGVLYKRITDTESTLLIYPSAKTDTSYSVLEGTTGLYQYSFAYNQYLENLDLGLDISYIGSRAFYCSESLIVLEIPNTIYEIFMDFALNSYIETVLIYDAGSDNVPNLIQENLDSRSYEEIEANVPLPEYLLPNIYLPDEDFYLYFASTTSNWGRSYVYICLARISEYETE